MSDGERAPDQRFPEQRFPDEREWLGLEPPPIAAEFVDATLRRVLADRGQPYRDEDPEALPPLPPALLEQYAPPPAPDFVASTVRRLEHDQAARLRALLLRYVAPEPSADFVARTLRALQREPRPVVHLRRLRRGLALLAAAALLAWLLPWPTARPTLPERLLLAAGSPLPASAWAPTPWPLARRRLAAADDPLALPLAAADGVLLLARQPEVR